MTAPFLGSSLVNLFKPENFIQVDKIPQFD